MHSDWLVVGAGLTGATFAERIATVLNLRVLVIERRSHVAGNAFDYYTADGLLVHRYGSHIFHTVSERVWRYLSRFTDWIPYEHRVLGSVDGLLVPIPFNLTSLHALIPGVEGERLEALLVDAVGFGSSIPILKLREHSDSRLHSLAELVYEKIFAGYSAKQWGIPPEELDRSVTSRVPIVVSHDDRYFHDPFQGLPTDGYTAMVGRMLHHPNITVELETDYAQLSKGIAYDNMVYTGPVDELCDRRYGTLPYRSLRFETDCYEKDFVQPVGVINYPNEHSYTRTLEHKHLTGQRHVLTAVTTEWPQPYVPGDNEPYYPLPTPASRRQYDAYKALLMDSLPGGIVLAGRLADYRYYNMDQAVNRALVVFRERIIGRRRSESQK